MSNRKLLSESTVKPIWSPQINSGAHDFILGQLDKNNFPYTTGYIDPNELKPSQISVNNNSIKYFNDCIANKKQIDPIYVAQGQICDGHAKVYAAKNNPKVKGIYAIQIGLPFQDACAILNKYNDRFEFENGVENEITETEDDDKNLLLGGPESESESGDTKEKKSKIITVYSPKPIQKDGKHNFVITTEKPRFTHKYDLQFENLHEIPDESLTDDPISSLYQEWFNSNDLNEIEKMASKVALTSDKFMTREIAKEAKKRKFDGIQFGSKYIMLP